MNRLSADDRSGDSWAWRARVMLLISLGLLFLFAASRLLLGLAG